MSTWNFRIVEDDHGFLSICEVYYDEDGMIDGWSNASAAGGETIQELNQEFNLQQDAFYEPVLKFDEEGTGLEEHPVYIKRTEVQHDSAY